MAKDTLCSPLIAAGPLADLAFAAEVCYGDPVPPGTIFKTVRRRSTSLALTKDSYDSEEVRSDRMVSDSRHGIRRVGGDIEGELSVNSYDALMEGVMGNVWFNRNAVNFSSTPAIISMPTQQGDDTVTIEWQATNPHTLGLRDGDIVNLGETLGVDLGYPAGHPLLGIIRAVSATTDVVTPLAEYREKIVGAFGTVAPKLYDQTALLVRGQPENKIGIGNIPFSFQFERAFPDIGQYILYTGVRVDSVNFTLPATGIATVTFGLMGKNASPLTGQSITGATAPKFGGSMTGAAQGTTLTLDSAAHTITLPAAPAATTWQSLGVKVGDIVVFRGMTNHQNNNPRTVVGVSGGKSLIVAEPLQDEVTTVAWNATVQSPPTYEAAPTTAPLVAVSGGLFLDGQEVATVTSMDVSISNGLAGSEVVGKNVIPKIMWGNQQSVTGNLTVLFDSDIGATLYNKFDLEREGMIVMVLKEEDPSPNVMGNYFVLKVPRAKFNEGSIGDAAPEGIPISMTFRGLLGTDPNGDRSQIVFLQRGPLDPRGLMQVPLNTVASPFSALGLTATFSVAFDEPTGITVTGDASFDHSIQLVIHLDGVESYVSVDVTAGDDQDTIAASIATALTNAGVAGLTGAAATANVVALTTTATTVDVYAVQVAPFMRTAMAGTGTASATITISGDALIYDATATATVTVTGIADDLTTSVAVPQGTPTDDVATALAAALDGMQDAGASITLAASAAGSVITVTEGGGANIDALVANIA